MTNDSKPPQTYSSTAFSDEMAQYLQVYIDESEEELEGLVGAILELEVDPRQADALQKSFRMLHSLKGSSGMMGFEVVGNFAHELEDRFERYRAGKSVLDRETTTVVLKCVDFFRSFLNRLRAGDLVEGDPSALLNQLREVEQRSAVPSTSSSSAPAAAAVRPSAPMTISGGLKIVVRFRPGLQLADLKARLIVSRLSSIGEIIACEPPIDDAHSFDELPLFSMTLVTDRTVEDVRKIANVDGVESVQIEGGELTAADFESNQAPQAPPANRIDPVEAAPVRSDDSPPLPPVATTEVTDAPDTESTNSKGQAGETLRVDIGRLDHLMNLTGELVVTNARLTQISSNISPLFRRNAVVKKSKELTESIRQRFDQIRQSLDGLSQQDDVWMQIIQGLDEDLEGLDRQSQQWQEVNHQFADMNDAVDQLTRVSKNLQRGVLNTRMVPVGPLFNRFKRVIRDLAVGRNKQVHLAIRGEKTELDKRMIDALGDPLLHLVRNSIDHGLEQPEQRVAAGKPESGTIFLEAAHRGNNVWITIRDDGAGINTEKIRGRIVERGLVTATQARDLTEEQVIDFIWHPGFSTAEAITEISGRGVGMDIVRNAISDLSGMIDVASVPGQGTTFTIRLPLTLAIIHSLLIRYRDDMFSIPIEDVREIVSVPRDQVHSLHRHVNIDVRGELIPLVSMGGVFTWRSSTADSPAPSAAMTNTGGPLNVVILQSRGKTLGLSVDSLVGRADLVIKSLSENLHPVRGLSGASILGDGAVSLMLDCASLIELATERASSNSSS